MSTIYKMPPSEVRENITACMEAGLVPFVTSSPGLGKSAVVKQIAEEFGLQLIDLRLSQCAPEDLMGLPMRNAQGRAEFAPFAMFPIKGDPKPEGKNGWLLFLDEFNSATTSVQAAAYKLILDHMVGMYELHEDVYCVCAGNLATDRAIVKDMSTAMQSRLIHLEMVVSHREFMDHAMKNDFDHRIMGFLEFQPAKLHLFKADHADKTFACPRTWEFASKLIKGKPVNKISPGLIAGTVSDGVAVEFMEFLKEYDNLPSYQRICAEPDQVEIPSSSGTRFAIVTMLLSKYDRADFADVAKFMKRMPPEIQVIYFRGVLRVDAAKPEMRRTKEYIAASHHLTRFLTDDDANDATNSRAA